MEFPCGSRMQRIPSTVSLENVQCTGIGRAITEKELYRGSARQLNGHPVGVDEERGQ